jgi:ATP-dependent Lhr-like helicase
LRGRRAAPGRRAGALRWLIETTGVSGGSAPDGRYLAAARAILGVVQTQETLVLERFFDDAGGMQLVLHAPLGARVNKAWGLALRKRFCRSFNFELQAAATDEAIVLSLGAHHSFPLDDVFYYLSTNTVRDVLIQAMLVAPMFQSRWRWNATVPSPYSFRGGRRSRRVTADGNEICPPRPPTSSPAPRT